MSVSTTHATVADLLKAFSDATPDRVDEEWQRLVAAVWDGTTLWSGGELTDLSQSAVPVLIAELDRVGDDRKGYLAILLGLLAEAEYPATDGPVTAAVREGLDTYLGILAGAHKDQPLTLALLYLLSHLPADRDRILATAAPLGLDAPEQTRLERALADLDPAEPDLGRMWPSPSVWKLTDEEREFDREWIGALTPEQTLTNWQNDTRMVFGYAGAMAYWAVRHGMPVDLTDQATPADPVRNPAGDLDVATFGQYAEQLRCPACHGALDFQESSVRCAACSITYPLARGILDLAEGINEDDGADVHEATAALSQKLAELPSMGVYYESVLRPAYLRIAGANWGGAVTPAEEDGYLTRHIRPNGGPILDLAAGAGRWTAVVAQTVGTERLIALDMGLPMLTVLRGRLPEVPAVRASALDVPFADESLGAVNCWNALQAFPDDAERAISEIGRILRPGGTFTMMTFLFDTDLIVRHFQASHFFPSRPAGQLLFDRDEVGRWLSNAGMTVIQESNPGTFLFITAQKL
ncbi:class I SAM-dependent methyltransferase [Sphaerisporangium sp. TRM90804]|uniref:class I SAM-dependent methyltransferase n=1 Tax=Sphaerisporangium sp. TRM90804 TaxID=3031113 RepID=UPI00244A8DE1|nr:class I SAM-dependent methyltransferase [Sphaerisporangium sp. TRM90804]MDH2424500.1 class I SAM-dependent methyltransferase [Sphaerisporangium sp. TRM90804]